MTSPIQRIIFGNPGTGKSRSIDHQILPHELKIEPRGANVIKTVFHPEYTYGDFMGKLLPLSRKREDGSSQVEYKFYPGHLLLALVKAYRNLATAHAKGEDPQNVALVIDEINRGNSAAIFGTAFQLLDRDPDGYSSYQVTLSELEFQAFIEGVGQVKDFIENPTMSESTERWILSSSLSTRAQSRGADATPHYVMPSHPELPYTAPECIAHFRDVFKIDLEHHQLRFPPNLSLIGTMNTSDNSIYFMDSAFKRRWDWFFYDWDDQATPPPADYEGTLDEGGWRRLVKSLNRFLKEHHSVIRGIEDKQVGYYFIKSWTTRGSVSPAELQSKLMFFVWDSVFQRDKRPLLSLLNSARPDAEHLGAGALVTFGDFCRLHNEFVRALLSREP